MQTIVGAEATLTIDEERVGGAITSLVWGGQEFIDSYHEVYGGRWSAFLDGGEMSQSSVVIQANRVTTKKVVAGGLWVDTLPIGGRNGTPLPAADPVAATILQQGADRIEISTSPPDFAGVEDVVGELRVFMEMDVLGNPHIIRYRSQFFLDSPTGGEDVAVNGAAAILGKTGATKLPHWAPGAPLLYLREEVVQNQYVIDMRPNTATDKTKEYEVLPASGGPVVGKGDGTRNVGIYHRVPHLPPQLGASEYAVRWREDEDVSNHQWREMQRLKVSHDGTPQSATVHTDEVYLVVGNAQDVAEGFRDLHNYFSSQPVSSVARMGSAMSAAALKL